MIQVKWNKKNGGISSLVNTADPNQMNWVEGKSTWGTVKNAEIVSVSTQNHAMTAVMEHHKAEITVVRKVTEHKIVEQYCFKNTNTVPVFFQKGEIGIYITFNDSYDSSDLCMTNRCNTHIWCGESTAWVNALKMGVSDINLGLVLTKGKLNAYSVEREESSNDRGDFIFHPSPFSLEPDEEYVLEWELFFHKGNEDFERQLLKYDLIFPKAEHYTVFQNEAIQIHLNQPAEIELFGKRLAKQEENFTYQPSRIGEHRFILRSGGKETYINIMVMPRLAELFKKRVDYIMMHQQYQKPGSHLDGAYLIYDWQEHNLYFDQENPDHNASRERLGMGLLIAEYVKRNPDDQQARESLFRYCQFVFREFVDLDSGNVYDTIQKNADRIRLYNASWAIMFLVDLYQITKEKKYLLGMVQIIRKYYAGGGSTFYPNGWFPLETIEALRNCGMEQEADEILTLYREHVDNMVKIGTSYPPHEVNYEQTIVTPGATFISQFVRITGEKQYIGDVKKQIDVLERFNGHQPDYHLYETAIRHWDDFWFGKSRLYGDTFPHYWSALSGLAFLNYYKISHDPSYREKAEENIRNCLCLFFENGAASCAYVYPYTVNGIRGEFFDGWANDQDFALYYAIKYLTETEMEQ